jgi:hypothetical protein
VVPTDKTNSFRVMDLDTYSSQVKAHLQNHAKPISHKELQEVKQQGLKLLDNLTPHLSWGEYGYIEQSLQSHAVPTPKLLIKDHKPTLPDGSYPTRLIIPASNFVSAFPKVGYLGIKKILQEHKLDCMPYNIEQASHLKTQIEELHLTPKTNTIISIDAQDYYPSIKFKLVKQAIDYFSAKLPQQDRIKIDMCLDMIKFGMSSTYIRFQDQYYEYDGAQDENERGLTIGGYESAWLSDIVGSYIFIKTSDCFDNALYRGTYRDDGIAIFKSRMSYSQITQWRDKFQSKVNAITGGDYLQYTCEIWADPRLQPMIPSKTPVPGISITNKPSFAYLDMEFFWHPDHHYLQFRVHIKDNQRLQYLNKGSAHPSACFRAIPKGVTDRLTRLTSTNQYNANTPLHILYPLHYEALCQAHLLPKHTMKTPTLTEAKHQCQPKSKTERVLQTRLRDARRTCYFCIGYSKAWTTPIWKIISDLKIKHNLPWLRFSMSYHRFANLRETFNADLTRKLDSKVISKDYATLPCNCASQQCNYNNHCRESIVVYKATCNTTGKVYIGCTQQKLKERMKAHYYETKKVHQGYHKFDTFSKHFATMAINFSNPSTTLIRNLSTMEILWKGNPTTAVKTFGTDRCMLCDQERLHLYKWIKFKPEQLINKHSEIHGSCRHKTRFHRFVHPLSSTDDSSMEEKVQPTLMLMGV